MKQLNWASRALPVAWTVAFVVLALWVGFRLNTFTVWADVQRPDGQTVRLPDAYGTVDHPFHVVRAETLRRALADGHPLRWVGHHQGGYPVDFYPLGTAALEAGLWAALMGALPMTAVHKIAVWLIFLLPGLAFLLLARRDGLPPGVAFVALALHAAVRGWWWSGGSMELVEWGLITNVTGATAAILFLPLLTAYLLRGRVRDGAGAALLAAFAIYANPRSAVALGAAAAGGTFAVLLASGESRPAWRSIVARLSAMAGIAAMIAAPELLSLVRFRDLYYFVRYEQYGDLGTYWRSSIEAVSGPVAVAGVAGLILAAVLRRHPHALAVAAALVIYAGVTIVLTLASEDGGIAQQLETTRLMPFQRYLVIYLAAWAIGWGAERARQALRSPTLVRDITFAVVAVFVLVAYVIRPMSFIPEKDRGLVAPASAATPAVADLRAAIAVADEEAPRGTAILILGSPLDSPLTWHTQLWAPLWSARWFFYDDWLWYWQTWHVGPYNPRVEHAYDPARITEVLAPNFLARHGIGAVIVADTARTHAAWVAAESAPDLQRIRDGIFAVYRVQDARTLISIGERNLNLIALEPGRVEMTGTSAGGAAVVRINWFPRWRATVNGQPAPLTRRDDGYMTLPVPSGTVTIDLEYVVDGWDWAGRVLCLAGLGAVAIWLLRNQGAWLRRALIAPAKRS